MSIKRNIQGIGLIEVLIALLVVSLGLLAIASLQGGLISSSGETKARNEARVLVEEKLEELRNDIILNDPSNTIAILSYEENLTNAETEETSIVGKNATFTRTVKVEDGSEDNQKVFSVVVEWTDKAGDVQSVTMSSEIVWSDPSASIVYAEAEAEAGSGALAPSPNNNSSTEGGEKRTSITEGTQLGDPNDPSDLLSEFWVARDSQDQLTVHLDGEIDASLTCHGDVVLPFSGTIYSINALTSLDVDISQLGECAFDVANVTVVNGFNSAPYACVVCGNCDEGGEGCPVPPSTNNNIGSGGWRGKIGLRGVDDDGGGQEQVCFNEQILDADAGASTGREYRTVRDGSTSEGINKPYACHDFLIVNSSGPDSSCSTAASGLASDTNIAPKKFERILTGAEANTVQLLDETYCTLAPSSVTFTGQITLVQTGGPSVNLSKLTLSTDAAGACDTLATNTPGTYSVSCNATTVASDVTITLITTQNGAVITPVSSYTIPNTDNPDAFVFDFTVTK